MSELTEFGPEFQKKCIVALLTDKMFFQQVYDGVSPEFFDKNSDRWMVKTTVAYFNQYKDLPTKAVFGGEEANIPDEDLLKIDVRLRLVDVFRTIENLPTDLPYIKDRFLAFCKKQKVKAAINKAADLVMNEKYEESRSVMNDAYSWGIDRRLGHDYVEDFEKRIITNTTPTIPTSWDCINSIMNGGLRVGELGCVMAGSGFGKSWMLCAIGLAGLREGKRVMHYTFEMSEEETALRYDSILMGIPPNKIKDIPSITRDAHAKLTGKLTVKWFAPLTITANAIIGHLQSEITFGNKPDLIIIDYADKMNSSRPASADWQRLGFVYEEIVSILGQLGVAGWTASQVQRSARQDDIIELDKIAGSIAKGDPAAFIMTVSRKVQDMVDGTARIHIAKNRYGPTGSTFVAWMKTDEGRIDIQKETTPEGMKILDMMRKGEEDATKRKQISYWQTFIESKKKN
jgi:hypothetical protein